MLPYWLLFGVCAIGAMLTRPNLDEVRRAHVMMWVMGVVIALMIGLRFQVGADWYNYQRMYEWTATTPFDRAIAYGDPGYQLISWWAADSGWRIWVVNLICGAIFSWGLIRFCLTQPYRWLTLVVAIPYVVIVVAMGYTRQGAALGLILAGLASYLRNGSILRFSAYIFFAATFHSTAVVAFVLVALTSPRNRVINALAAIAVLIVFYNLFLESSIERFYGNYIKTAYSSQGALIRVMMDVSAAVLFFFIGKRLDLSKTEFAIWRNFSIVSIFALVALFVVPSSTAVDRLAIYLLPIQLAVFGRLPLLSPATDVARLIPITLFALVQFTWFNFGAFSRLWVPYQIFSF